MSLLLQNSTKSALDQKMRAYWLIRTPALTEQEIASIQIVTEGALGWRSNRQSFPNGERAFATTVVECLDEQDLW